MGANDGDNAGVGDVWRDGVWVAGAWVVLAPISNQLLVMWPIPRFAEVVLLVQEVSTEIG